MDSGALPTEKMAVFSAHADWNEVARGAGYADSSAPGFVPHGNRAAYAMDGHFAIGSVADECRDGRSLSWRRREYLPRHQ